MILWTPKPGKKSKNGCDQNPHIAKTAMAQDDEIVATGQTVFVFRGLLR
jgi:hypothetical protein